MTNTSPNRASRARHISQASQALAIALLVAAACSSRPRAQADAAIALDDAAEIDAGLPDAAVEVPPDAPPDAPPPPPPPGVVEVHVFGQFDGSPSVGVRVLFAGPGDELVADVVTDAQGHASARMAAGYVTLIRASTSGTLQLTTVLGVKQGETIEFGAYPRDFTELGMMTPVFPPQPPVASLGVFSPCSFNGAILTVFADPACRQHVGILARSFEDPPLYSYRANQTLTAGGTVQMPAWQPMVNMHVALPDRTNPSNVQLSPFICLISDIGFAYSESPTVFGAFDLNFWRPNIGGDVLFRTTLTRADDRFIGKQEAAARATAADEVTLLLADLTARWVHRPVADTGGPSPVFRWRQEGQDTATVGWVSTEYTGRRQRIRWDIVGPFLDRGSPAPLESMGTYTLPQLPDPLLRINLSSDIDVAQIRILAVNPEVTYDQLRPTIARLFDFESAWFGGQFGLVNLEQLTALPNVRVVRFSGSH